MQGIVLVVHSDASRRLAIRELLARAGHAVIEAADAAAADGPVDLLVVDGSLSTSERARIDARIGQVPTVTVAGQSDAALVAEVNAHVRAANPMNVRLGPVVVDLQRRAVIREGARVGLTDKEAALLSWLMANPHRTVTRSELLRDVWGYHSAAVTRAVDVTVRRLRDKIEVDRAEPQFLVTEHGEGYRFVPPPEALDRTVADLRHAREELRAAVTSTHPRPAAVAAAAFGSLIGLGTLSSAERAALMPYLDRRDLEAGEVLIREDDSGDVFYMVLDGRIAVTRRGVHLRELGPGQQLGEVGFTGSARRTATATAIDRTTVVGLSRARFEVFVQNEPQTGLRVAMALLNTVGERLRDLTERLATR